MKQAIFFILLVSTASVYSQKIEINRIRFVINDLEYVWDLENTISENYNMGGTEPRYIASFFKYQPGDSVRIEILEKEIEHAKLRLKDSQLFYSTQISIVPPKRFPDKRTIVIMVTDGFKYRFGGGYAYGFFGNMNIKGRGDSLRLAAGLNNILIDYRKNIGLGKMYWGNKLYINPIERLGNNSTYAGYNVTPDMSVAIDFKENYKEAFYPSGGVSIDLHKNLILGKNLLKYGFSTYGSLEYLNKQFLTNYTLAPSVRYIPPIPLSLLVQGKYSHKDTDVFVASYLFYHLNSIIFPPIDLKLSPFIFCEFFETKAGVGIEIYFDVPIFTKFTFSYGWNLQGTGKFLYR